MTYDFNTVYLYGPVRSRRLGFSLGVDLFPKKICSFDCLYCQLGKTQKTTLKRFHCVDLPRLLKGLKKAVKKAPKINYITLSGSGEPTLHKNLDKIISAIKKSTGRRYPVCMITNSSLLHRKGVRQELKAADLIIPSLDAASAKNFYKINRPHRKVSFKKIIDGLMALRKEFKGQIWLEIMVMAGINDTIKEAKKFRQIIGKIKPDKVQLNLPVRPAGQKIKLPSSKRIDLIKKIINFNAEVVSRHYDGRKKFTAR